MVGKRTKSSRGRAFRYRGGIRINGTVIGCDTGQGRDLLFLSRAFSDGVETRAIGGGRSSRRQLLTTDTTLALLGRRGAAVRGHALVAAYGRPFQLGSSRVELFPSGHAAGAASLLCESEGRQLVYAGAVSAASAPGFGAKPREIRTADALCISARFGDPRFSFPPRDELWRQLDELLERARASGRPPVLLTAAGDDALLTAERLTALGLRVRAHRRMIATTTSYRDAAIPPPQIARFAGTLLPGEVLLWPPDQRDAPSLGALANPLFALLSGWACDPTVVASLRVEAALPLACEDDFEGLIAYVQATGAREVALYGAASDALAVALRARGRARSRSGGAANEIDSYLVGPPHQIALFTGEPAPTRAVVV